MPDRVKRTFSLRPQTLVRVRELAARYGSSQDAVVDRAVEDLERRVGDEDDATAWAAAADDPEFVEDAREIAAIFDQADRWPA